MPRAKVPEILEVTIPPWSMLKVYGNGPFVVWSTRDGNMEAFLGPRNENDRLFQCIIQDVEETVKIIPRDIESNVRANHHPIKPWVEYPDPTPLETSVERPPTIQETIQMYIREASFREALRKDDDYVESWDEANDFDIDEDEPFSEYEINEMQEEWDNEDVLLGQTEEPAAREDADGDGPPAEGKADAGGVLSHSNGNEAETEK